MNEEAVCLHQVSNWTEGGNSLSAFVKIRLNMYAFSSDWVDWKW